MELTDATFLDVVINLIDIGIVWFLFYKLLMLVRGTKAIQLVKGILVILIVQMVSKAVGLSTVWWLTDQVMTWGFLAIIIIFQPEFRRALESLGRIKIFGRFNSVEESELKNIIEESAESVKYMAKRRIGALIVFEKQTGLQEYVDTGIKLDANLSRQLLINTFFPNSPMHDGAVIISGEKLAAAGCFLPLSDNQSISKSFGTRHRAAIGISEVSDAIVVLVSEETGKVSVAKDGKITYDVELDALEEVLSGELMEPRVTQKAGGD